MTDTHPIVPGSYDPGPNPARITIRRMVEFGDIDKSGHYHNASVIRWLEAAEAIMHARLGIAGDTFGLAPRVSIELEFRSRLSFMDEVDIALGVVHVGRTSVRCSLEVMHDGRVAARGSMVAVYLPEGAEHAQPWPDDLRRAFREGGDRSRRSRPRQALLPLAPGVCSLRDATPHACRRRDLASRPRNRTGPGSSSISPPNQCHQRHDAEPPADCYDDVGSADQP